MVVFDNWKFREILKSIVEKKELNGDRISSKQQLYVRIGEALHVSPDTVKYWQRDKSSGPDPRTPELLKELEDYLGYPDALQKKINIEEEKTEDKRMDTVSEFQKQQIMEIYEVLKNFVSEMNIENEDEYYRIRAVIERKQLVLPDTIFNTILQFMDNVVEEYVFEAEYPDFTKEEAEYENGVMNIKTDGSYYILAEGEADWNRYLNRIEEKNWYVDFSDIQMICYKLTESGIWSHDHINPLYLEVEFPTYIEDDPKRQVLRYAMEALGDYLSHKSKGKEFCPDLVLKYARKYAEVCREKSLSEKMLEEAKKPEDIML